MGLPRFDWLRLLHHPSSQQGNHKGSDGRVFHGVHGPTSPYSAPNSGETQGGFDPLIARLKHAERPASPPSKQPMLSPFRTAVFRNSPESAEVPYARRTFLKDNE